VTAPVAHRTAITRGTVSRPTRLALDLGVLADGDSFFDYGCGRGEDVVQLRDLGFKADGWDPHHRPNQRVVDSDVINIGYVVNVIADPVERAIALQSAWQHARKALVVAARLNVERRTITVGKPFSDGFMTGTGTFQRFFDQAELRVWIDATLEVECVAMAPGVFVVFRSEDDANAFMLRTRRRRQLSVRISRASQLYDEHRQVLEELMGFFSDRGRLPAQGEVPSLQADIATAIGSLRRAWSIVEKVTDREAWMSVAEARRTDVLVNLALLKLNRRPNFAALPAALRFDIRALLGSYKEAVRQADDLLFSAGNLQLVSTLASKSPVGKRLPTAFYIHESAIELLPASLRVYEGCARWLVGTVDNANIVKFATDKAKVSYLVYPHFDKDPHPVLATATYVRLRELMVDTRSYLESENPPILHRKEQFVDPDYPERPKFERLTAQEERFGLLESDTRVIGNLSGWNERLNAAGLRLVGHRVVRRSA
jgi:DNA phosphorothioation-associated putative methyltransferase